MDWARQAVTITVLVLLSTSILGSAIFIAMMAGPFDGWCTVCDSPTDQPEWILCRTCQP